MRFESRNIPIWAAFGLCFISFAFIAMTMKFREPRKIQSLCETIVTTGSSVTDTIIHKDGDRIVLYLSFDDGPTAGSWNLNNISMSDSIHIDVFLIGKFVYKTDSNRRLFQLYQQNEFVEIGNHSYTHANNRYHDYYQRPDEVERDFLMNYDTLALRNRIARLPGRNCWQINGRSRSDLDDGRVAANTLAALGYRVFGWDIEWRYGAAGRLVETSAEMFDKVRNLVSKKKSFTSGHIVILCHDPMLADPYNELELRSFIQKIKSSGNYRFEFLSNYP